MNDRFDGLVGFSARKLIKRTAKIAEGAVSPVVLVDDLHFQLNNSIVVKKDFDIQNKSLIVDCFSEFDRIEYVCGMNISGIQVQ